MNISLKYREYTPELIPMLKSFSTCSHKDKDSFNNYWSHQCILQTTTKGVTLAYRGRKHVPLVCSNERSNEVHVQVLICVALNNMGYVSPSIMLGAL